LAPLPVPAVVAESQQVEPGDVEVTREPDSLPRGVARQRFVRIDPAQVLRPQARIEFFDDAVFDVRLTSWSPRRAGSSAEVWHGEVVDVPGAEVVAAQVDGALSLSVMLPSGRTYALSEAPNGQQRIEELVPAELPGCHSRETGEVASAAAESLDSEIVLPDVAQAPLDPSTTIDVLVLYTQAVESRLGGGAGAVARIAMNVAATNAAYEASGVMQRLRLAHAQRVDGYSEPNALGASLEHATSRGDGRLDGIHELRDRYGADQVSLLTSPTSPDACGVAWVPSVPGWLPIFDGYAFSVVAAVCTGDPRVLAHELAHNQGARHDPITARLQGMSEAQIASLPAPFSFGYIAPANVFHTIMAYGSSCGWCASLNRFSNPDLTVNGLRAGDARSDVRTTLNATYASIIAYRAAVLRFPPSTPILLEPGS
jgi:hypothetical protein